MPELAMYISPPEAPRGRGNKPLTSTNRHSDRLDRLGKGVTNTALRLNDAGRARITLKLASEAKDLHIDAAVEYVFMNACRLQQMFAAQRPLRCVEKRDQECVLAFCQGHRNSV